MMRVRTVVKIVLSVIILALFIIPTFTRIESQNESGAAVQAESEIVEDSESDDDGGAISGTGEEHVQGQSESGQEVESDNGIYGMPSGFTPVGVGHDNVPVDLAPSFTEDPTSLYFNPDNLPDDYWEVMDNNDNENLTVFDRFFGTQVAHANVFTTLFSKVKYLAQKAGWKLASGGPILLLLTTVGGTMGYTEAEIIAKYQAEAPAIVQLVDAAGLDEANAAMAISDTWVYLSESDMAFTAANFDSVAAREVASIAENGTLLSGGSQDFLTAVYNLITTGDVSGAFINTWANTFSNIFDNLGCKYMEGAANISSQAQYTLQFASYQLDAMFGNYKYDYWPGSQGTTYPYSNSATGLPNESWIYESNGTYTEWRAWCKNLECYVVAQPCDVTTTTYLDKSISYVNMTISSNGGLSLSQVVYTDGTTSSALVNSVQLGNGKTCIVNSDLGNSTLPIGTSNLVYNQNLVYHVFNTAGEEVISNQTGQWVTADGQEYAPADTTDPVFNSVTSDKVPADTQEDFQQKYDDVLNNVQEQPQNYSEYLTNKDTVVETDDGEFPDPAPAPDPSTVTPSTSTPTPSTETPEQSANDFVIGDLTRVFPFCVPWDLYTAFELFRSSPVAPSFDWNFGFSALGFDDGSVHVDLSGFDPVASVLRTVELVAMIVGLILLTRNIMRS